jgi:hypothetical protein
VNIGWIDEQRRCEIIVNDRLPYASSSPSSRSISRRACRSTALAGSLARKLESLAQPQAFTRLLKKTRKKKWVVYSKRPFVGPQQVLDYLGRYTHRLAISNHRLLRLEDGRVSFSWKDYVIQPPQSL